MAKKTDQNKAWNKKTTSTRIFQNREIKKSFRIYCEGQSTEPEYFKAFPITTEYKVETIGLGRSKTALVKKVVQLEAKIIEKDPDCEIWVVFDKDERGNPKDNEDFDKSIQLADNNGFKVAYSNDSFELWFVLHFKYTDVDVLRSVYYDYLSDMLVCSYEKEGKNKDFSKKLYSKLLEKQPKAIENAEKLHQNHINTNKYSDKKPYTSVYKLVKELNKCIKK